LGTGLSARPTRRRRRLCLPNNQSLAGEDARSSHRQDVCVTSLLATPELREGDVLRAVPLSARDELVRRMKSEIVPQFSPEPINEPIFLDWADDADDDRY